MCFCHVFLQEIRGRCEGKCEVTVESRSYCKRCRLAKCFNVGMNRDLILSKCRLTASKEDMFPLLAGHDKYNHLYS